MTQKAFGKHEDLIATLMEDPEFSRLNQRAELNLSKIIALNLKYGKIKQAQLPKKKNRN